jgi:hypothetical protein
VLRWPWLLAIVAVCAVGVLLARGQGSRSALPALLAAAPVLPLLCVAGSYGGRADPLEEVSRTTPTSRLRILLIRSGQVLVLCLPLLTAVSLLLPPNNWAPGAVTWLLPSLTLTLAALLLGSYIGYRPATALTMTCWMLAVAVLTQVLGKQDHEKHLHSGQLLAEALGRLIGDSTQLLWAFLAAVFFHWLTRRRHSYDRARGRR